MKGKRLSNHLYVATDGTFHKIGITVNVKNRRGQLMSPQGKREVKMVRSWFLPHTAFEVEAIVKGILHSRRVMGHEWFNVTRDELLELVEYILAAFNKAPRPTFPVVLKQLNT